MRHLAPASPTTTRQVRGAVSGRGLRRQERRAAGGLRAEDARDDLVRRQHRQGRRIRPAGSAGARALAHARHGGRPRRPASTSRRPRSSTRRSTSPACCRSCSACSTSSTSSRSWVSTARPTFVTEQLDRVSALLADLDALKGAVSGSVTRLAEDAAGAATSKLQQQAEDARAALDAIRAPDRAAGRRAGNRAAGSARPRLALVGGRRHRRRVRRA